MHSLETLTESLRVSSSVRQLTGCDICMYSSSLFKLKFILSTFKLLNKNSACKLRLRRCACAGHPPPPPPIPLSHHIARAC